MRKGSWIVGAIIVLAIVIGGGFALFHSSNGSNSPSRQASNNQPAAKTQAPAVNNAVLTTKTDPQLGQYLADPQGKPLYTFGGDKANAGTSTCTGSCLAEWPAYQASSVQNLPAGVNTIKRSDNGKAQYTYQGLPLYYFVDDSQGKVTGDGVENFHLAKPAASTSAATSNSTSASSAYPY